MIASQKVRRQPVHPDDPYGAEQQHAARNVRHHARVGVNEIIAVDGSDDAQYPDERDSRCVRHARHQTCERLAAQHQVRGQESDVHHDHDADDEQRSQRPELTPGLDHLRNAERRALRRVQRHEHGAGEIADREADDGPDERQREHGHRKAARDDGQEHEIRAEPNGEQIAVSPVALIVRYRLDRGELEPGRLFSVVEFLHKSPGTPKFGASSGSMARRT